MLVPDEHVIPIEGLRSTLEWLWVRKMPDPVEASPTVYIVDDDPSIRHSLITMVQSLSLPALSFSSADEFLASCDETLSGCLILDIRMPGMGGFELYDKLIADGIHLPAIMITGHGDRSMVQRAMSEGIVDFLEKPFRPERLVEALDRALNHSDQPE